MELARWAAFKGILVLATGDFTHPQWSAEIREMLEEAEGGLLRLKKEYVPNKAPVADGFGPEDVRFMLNVEISSIYKKNGATRKVHNLVFMPDMDAMERFNARLDKMGNIRSDGRPILGVDSRTILEIALETAADSFVIPAHVWTPWFSVLGSKSGFDSIEECFDDLAPYVFALETGLSSDPEMNHLVSSLDKYTLISNSDTHSPAKLGREANIFNGPPGYLAIREAIKRGTEATPASGSPDTGWAIAESSSTEPQFVGTIEFFPEEGKYHLDGHRKCQTRLDPQETAKLKGLCPACGREVTVGVMNRVMELADRKKGVTPGRAAPFWRMVPLSEIVAQTLNVGQASKKVAAMYADLVRKIGPELSILWQFPLDRVSRHAPEIIVEAIRRVRKGEVFIKAGFDGEYGTVELFGHGEREMFSGQAAFVPAEAPVSPRPATKASTARVKRRPKKSKAPGPSEDPYPGLNADQEEAIAEIGRPVLVQAGPGTGKTRTLTERIASLLERSVTQPEKITAVTFTRKAAREMRERLAALRPEHAGTIWVGTFHQLGARILEYFHHAGVWPRRNRILDEDEALALFRSQLKTADLKCSAGEATSLFNEIGLLKQNLVPAEDADLLARTARAYDLYEKKLRDEDAYDLDDLIGIPVKLLSGNPSTALRIAEQWADHLLVDEFQDVNKAQYELVRLLSRPDGRGLFVIGDPNQAIYGFRGSDVGFFFRFCNDYPSAQAVCLRRNYRSHANLTQAAGAMLGPVEPDRAITAEKQGSSRVNLVQLPSPAAEGEFIIRTIDAALGGTSFYALDSRSVSGDNRQWGFKDFAVVYRLNAIGDALEEIFRKSNIPFQRASRSCAREEAEALDPRAEAVSLMTIHASKGLEFPVVFIAGCEDGIIPYVPPDGQRTADLDEEKRLLYVAMTRAAEDLYILHCHSRSLYGVQSVYVISRFLEAADPTLYEFRNPLAKKRIRGPSQCELFG